MTERMIGSIRRECLDYIFIFGTSHMRQTLKQYTQDCHRVRLHLLLAIDSQILRAFNVKVKSLHAVSS